MPSPWAAPAAWAGETQEAVLAGGCFWCLEHDLESLPGVLSAESGYSGGHVESPTYQQVSGEPVDLSQFTASHASLTRQLYPLLQQELRVLLVRIGLEQIRLPFDLAAQVHDSDAGTVRVSGAVH